MLMMMMMMMGTVAAVVVWGVLLAPIFVLALALWQRSRPRKRRCVCVLVLGDLGRSPRMQYHILSLAKTVDHVYAVAYSGSRPVEDLVNASNITRVAIPTPPAIPAGWPRIAFVAYAPVKVLLQALQLLYTLLFRIPRYTHLLMQNPPSIPTLPIAVFVSRVCGTTLVVDWHNYGFSILALKLGRRHPFVRISEWIERTFGRFGHRHLCVTNAMAADLRDNWGIMATALHDRPPKYFKPKSAPVTHDLFKRFEQDYKRRLARLRQRVGVAVGQTLLTEQDPQTQEIHFREDRPAVLVSGTSWTPDEDFSILLSALQGYDQEWQAAGGRLPPLLCVITGKGPLRQHYEREIERLDLQGVTIVTAWLRIEDYPRMLASADLGISLHVSSSGLDLPMKVVDMFGCELPACSIDFSCLHELVKHGENGYVFQTSAQLQKQLQRLLLHFPECPQLRHLAENLRGNNENGWETSWNSIARRLFE